MVDYLVPLILLGVSLAALWKQENSYEILLSGAADGLRLLAAILPALILLLTALAPVFSLFGIPPECAMLVLVRPISGSAALAVGSELMARYGVDSEVGRTAAVMLGSTETTFYTLSVYFGAAGIKRTRYTLPAALFADFVGFFTASWTVRLLFP